MSQPQPSAAALALAEFIERMIDAKLDALRPQLVAAARAEQPEPLDPDQELTVREAAALLALSPKTLNTWRRRPPEGGGPRFRKHGRNGQPGGRVTYRRGDLVAWAASRGRTNTNAA
jgi:hypothetical protein